MSLETKRDLLARFRGPYEEAGKPEKGRILDNLCEATGWNRKYAMSALRQLPLKKRKVVRKRKRRYGLVEEAALHQAWKLSGYLASKRLAPFMEEFLTILERHGELTLAESTKKKLSVISAATIDRLLKRHRNSHPRPLCSTKPGGLLKKQIALRMGNEWSEDVPGYCEIDTVAHSGGAGDGDFFYTLSLTDVCTGWFEGAALRNKSRKETVDRLKSIQKRLPFKILGLDSDNGSEFINYHLKNFCEEQEIQFTRCRPYHKNDQCRVEQKNSSVVRRHLGYGRFDTEEHFKLLSKGHALIRFLVNYFEPSLKKMPRDKEGNRPPTTAKTPYKRLVEAEILTEAQYQDLQETYLLLNPVALRNDLHEVTIQLLMMESSVRFLNEATEDLRSGF